MAWILLEGLDRSGKSTVAEYYKQQGYEVIHLSAPQKKYFEPGYSGPSYLEEIVEMYNIYAGKDVVFDRTCYGELVWPEVFNRIPLLNVEDYEYLASLEYNQDAVKYLLFDEDTEAHWKRCADDKEPINRMQFVQAARLYDKLELEKGFEKKQLGDFSKLAAENKQTAKLEKAKKTIQKKAKSSDRDGRDSNIIRPDNGGSAAPDHGHEAKNILTMEQKLNRANAIRTLLSGKIIKKKDSIYEDLEKDIRAFLQEDLERLFSPKPEKSFSEDEVIVLKSMAKRIIDKME